MTEPIAPSSFPQPDVSTVQLVQSIMDNKPTLAELLRLTAVPFWFDRDLVAALRARHDGLDENFLALLQALSFVQIGHGRCWYSPEMRGLLLQQWAGDPQGLATAHRRALGHFERRLADSSPDDPAAYEELLQARLYHLLAVDEQAGIQLLQQLFDKAEDEYRVNAATHYVDVAEGQRPLLSREGQDALDYMQGRVYQLGERWDDSRTHLERMEERVDLSDARRALVRSALARSLVELGQEPAGIALYEQALAEFDRQGDRSQAARTMVGLGNAYLSMTDRVWGRGWLRPPAPRVRFQVLYDIGRVLARLPLILYIMAKLGFRSSLTAIHRIDTDIDWMVARLLALAAEWFRRVEATSGSEDAADPVALIDAWEGMAHLCRLLDCPRQAEAINHRILRLEGVHLEGYPAARARLGLAHALLLRGEAAQARQDLEQILPVFTNYGHRRRIAETQTLLARAELFLGKPDAAVRRYVQALDSWRQLGDEATETDVVHELEALRGRPDLSGQARQALDQASRQVVRRHYRTRYSHPFLTNFRRASLIGLVILFFFTIRFALRTEYGTQLDPTVDLVKPTYIYVVVIPTDQGGLGSLTKLDMKLPDLVLSDVALTIGQQLRPKPPLNLLGVVILGAFGGYLLLYTILGLIFIARTSLRIRPGQVQGIVTSQEGIQAITATGDGELRAWDQVRLLLRADRILVRSPLRLLSFFALFGGTGPLEISPFTQHYEALQQQARGRLDPVVPVKDLGFALLHSKSGWLFLAALAYLVLFFLLAALAPDLVLGTVGSIPYNLADLFGLAYVALALPLAWWFAVQPLRAHWLVSPKTPVVWFVGGAGLALAALSAFQLHWWHLPLGRPDIAIGILAILLVGLAGLHILRAREQGGAPSGEYAWPAWLRLVVALVASLVVVATLVSIGWELVSFHHLVVGNTHLRQAEALEEQGKHGEAEPIYEEALQAFKRSASLRSDPYLDNSRGIVHAQLGKFADAVVAYRTAQLGDPEEPTYVWNLAQLYADQAADPASRSSRISYYDMAIQKLGEAIALMERHPRRFAPQLITVHMLRAAVYYDRGRLYRDMPNRDQAMEDFLSALIDYDWLVDAAEKRKLVGVFNGRGWALLRLREMVTGQATRLLLEAAIEDFNRAIQWNADDVSAYIGLGWAHLYLAETYPLCREGKGDADAFLKNWRHLQQAIEAYDEVIARSLEHPQAYASRGHLHWLIAGCDPQFTKQPALERSLADYSRAIALDPGRADLYYTRGYLYYALWFIMPSADRGKDTVADYKAFALADFQMATALEPHNQDQWITLARVASEWRDYATSARAWQKVAELDPKGDNAFLAYRWLGWWAYKLGEYVRSLDASGKALAIDPSNAAVRFNEGLAYLAIGDLQSALQSYRSGVQAANAQADENTRSRWYRNAIDDLEAIQTDPRHAADIFTRFVEAGRDRRLLAQTCQVVYDGPDGVSVRSGFGPAYDPHVAVMTEGAEFIVLARSPDNRWLRGLVKELGVPGWVRYSKRLLSCPDGALAAPVDETVP